MEQEYRELEKALKALEVCLEYSLDTELEIDTILFHIQKTCKEALDKGGQQ